MINDFLIAIGNFKRYNELQERRGGHTFLYMLLLTLICSIGIVVIPLSKNVTRIANGLMEVLPNFSITQDGMQIDETFDFDYAGIKILATNEKIVTEDDFGDAVQGAIFDKDKILLKNLGKVMTFEYKEFAPDNKSFSITKSDLPKYKSFYISMIIGVGIATYLAYLIVFIVNSVFIGAIASIVGIFKGERNRISYYINLAIYAKTLPTVITAFIMPFGIQMNSYVEDIITLIIVFIALKYIRETKTGSTV